MLPWLSVNWPKMASTRKPCAANCRIDGSCPGTDADRAAHALETAGFSYTKRDVLVVRVLDEPGALGEVALVMAHAGINIDSVYVTTRGYVVLGVDGLAGADQVAGG